jgi:hypothetical protein
MRSSSSWIIVSFVRRIVVIPARGAGERMRARVAAKTPGPRGASEESEPRTDRSRRATNFMLAAAARLR